MPSVSWEGEGEFDDESSANTGWTAPSEQQYAVPYDLTLAATNTQGEASDTVTVTVRAIPGPAAPSLSSSNITSNSVQLNWTTPATLGNGAVTFVGIRYRMVGAARYTWFGSFRVEDASAVVSGLEESTRYEFQIFARNVNGGRSDYSTHFATTEPDLTPTCPSIGNESGEVNQLFRMTFTAATGGDGTLTHSVSGLPSTLSYSLSNGVFTIRGTPTTAETISVEYEATDSDGDSCSEDFDIVIDSEDLVPSCPSISDDTGTVDVVFTLSFKAATGGDGTLTHSISGLPSTLPYSRSGADFTISGTPTSAETIEAEYKATDGDGDSCTEDFDIVISPAPVDNLPSCPNDYTLNGVVNTSFSKTVTAATGGDGTLTHEVTGLPRRELSFDATSLTISGTPTSSRTISATYKATDSDIPASTSDSCTTTISIVISPAPVDNLPSCPNDYTLNGVVNTSFSKTVTAATGGDGTLTHEVTGLPRRELSFDATSLTISGTPTSSRTISATYKTTDSDIPASTSDSCTTTISIVISPAPVDNLPSCPNDYTLNGVVNTSFSKTVTAATGGDGTLTHEVTGLPRRELSFDATSLTISGTPTSSRTISATYKATDSDIPASTSDSCTTTISIVIAPNNGNPPPGSEFGFVDNKMHPDIVMDLGTDIPVEGQILPVAEKAAGRIEYSISRLPRGVTFRNEPGVRFLSGRPTEVIELTVTFSATDTGTLPPKIIHNEFKFIVNDVPEPSELVIELRIDEVDGKTASQAPKEDRIGTNLMDTMWWTVLTHMQVRAVDPYKEPQDPMNPPKGDAPVENFDSYEFRLRVEEDTGVDIDADGNESCSYPAEANRAQIDWKWAKNFKSFSLVRCRIGDAASTIKLDVRIRGVPTRQALGKVTITLVEAIHHGDDTATYRLCGTMPTDVDFEDHIDAGADLWDAKNVGITFPDANDGKKPTDPDEDVATCGSFTSGYTDVVAPTDNDRFEQLCSKAAFACARSDDATGSQHFQGQQIVFRRHMSAGKKWVATEAEAKDENNIWATAIMAHEFGHIGGLGHTRDGDHLMRDGYNKGRLHITAYDESAMEEIYD